MLNELLKNELEEIQEQQQDFRVTNLESCNWCFRKLRALEEKEKEVRDLVESEKMRLDSYLTRETEDIKQSKEYFEGLIKAYYIELKADNPKAKLTTPYGKVSCRKTKKWSYDEDIVLDYLRENSPQLIRVKEEIDKSNLKKLFAEGINTTTGEIVPGIKITEEETVNLKVE